MDKIIKPLEKINKISGYFAASLILVLALVVVYDVVLRYFFNAPTEWGMEICQYLLGAITLLSGGYCLMIGGHVRVDIIYSKFSKKAQNISTLTFIWPILIYCGIMFWLGGKTALKAFEGGWVSLTPCKFYQWPVLLTVPIGGILLGLQVITEIVKTISDLKAKNQ